MTLHPDAGRNDHIHGDEHLSDHYDFEVTITVTRTILVKVSASDPVEAKERVQDAFEDCDFEDQLSDAENDSVVYEVS